MTYNAVRVQLPRASMLCASWSSKVYRSQPLFAQKRLLFSNSSQHTNHFFDRRKTLLFSTVGGITIGCYVLLHSSAQCKNEAVSEVEGLGRVTLYQYQTCPFCCKTRAYLDYSGIPYEVVEVNPISRKQIKFSKFKGVPFIVADGVEINDSSLIISVLRTCAVNKGKLTVSQALDLYPEMSFEDHKGKTKTERNNKYFVMYGEDGDNRSVSLAERREEREWRQWVDDTLVHAIPPNVYRTPSEALQAFGNVTTKGNFGTIQRVCAKYLGAVGMYFLGKKLKKKYNLSDDVREDMYKYCYRWREGMGDRRFMGGDKPNLADLAMYGVLNAMEGLRTFDDIMTHTSIGPWYGDVKKMIENTSSKH